MVKLTGAALESLRQHYMDLKPVFEPGDGEKVFLEGTLFTGLGEGRYYMSLEGYRKAFRDKLGFDPFPGTLNLRLNSPHDMETRRQLDGRKHILIPTFSDGTRTYSSVKLLRCKVNDSEDGAVLLIERTHYGADVLEVVAPVELRRRFRLKDGDRVRVQVFT